jgi:hypothetical protein
MSTLSDDAAAVADASIGSPSPGLSPQKAHRPCPELSIERVLRRQNYRRCRCRSRLRPRRDNRPDTRFLHPTSPMIASPFANRQHSRYSSRVIIFQWKRVNAFRQLRESTNGFNRREASLGRHAERVASTALPRHSRRRSTTEWNFRRRALAPGNK